MLSARLPPPGIIISYFIVHLFYFFSFFAVFGAVIGAGIGIYGCMVGAAGHSGALVRAPLYDIWRHGAGSQTQRPCTFARLRPRACMGWAASMTLAAILQHFTRRAQPGRDQLYPLTGARCGGRPGLLFAWAGHTSAYCAPCDPAPATGGLHIPRGRNCARACPVGYRMSAQTCVDPRQSTPSGGRKLRWVAHMDTMSLCVGVDYTCMVLYFRGVVKPLIMGGAANHL